MDIKRRDFLKVAGVGTAVGTAAGLAKNDPVEASTPPESPASEKSWAMVVDTTKCLREEGCEDCTLACHKTHNVPNIDNKQHEVKWIWKESFEHALHESTHARLPDSIKHSKIPVLCNHCANPPCTHVCPTGATWKREKDGLVMMDWHRCIGCRYCMAACPYGSRSFNFKDPREQLTEIKEDYPTRTKGVVEKCTFCEERLARGEQPACVEACAKRGKALTFGDPDDPHSEISKILDSKFTIQRKPHLGTQPQVYYVVAAE